jgi:N12 class adenine-specific DNA methylase
MYLSKYTEMPFDGPVSKFNANIEAIKLAKSLDGRPITPEERSVLLKYSGWGDSEVLNRLFPKSSYGSYYETWGNPLPEYLKLLTPDEISSIKSSALNAHYTSLGVIRSIYKGLMRMGLDLIPNPQILEPAAGIGHFFGCMPETIYKNSCKVAVELEPLASSIMDAIYDDVKVFNTGYEKFGKYGVEDSNAYSNYFDLIVTNVPFGDYEVFDQSIKEKYLRKSIHNYFIANAIKMLTPGGVLAVITSRYTMDASDTKVRKYISDRCSLLGAFRLPNTAFKKNAGTQVVTDILFLQKKTDGVSDGCPFIATDQVAFDVPGNYYYNNKCDVNKYFIDHPDHILGTPKMDRGMYSGMEYTVDPTDPIEEMLDRSIKFLPENVFIYDTDKPKIIIEKTDIPVDFTSDDPRITSMIEIHHTVKNLIDLQVKNENTEQIRLQLNTLYDNFVSEHGSLRSRKNESLIKNASVEIGLILPLLRSLETNTGQKANIFKEDTVRHSIEMPDIRDPKEALLFCLDKFGHIDMEWLFQTTGQSYPNLLTSLKGLIFKTPDRKYVTADEYLSGNIFEKLEAAKAAAEIDPSFEYHVSMLQDVMPRPLGPGEIYIRLGADWIPDIYITEFMKMIVPSYCGHVKYIQAIPEWIIIPDKSYYSRDDYQIWGTGRKSATEILQDALNLHTPTVYDVYEEHGIKKSVTNTEETLLAQAKLQEMLDKFSEWVLEDATRSEYLVSLYNEKFNVWRERSYDGSHLTLPGISRFLPGTQDPLIPYQHQLDAIWQGLQSKTMMLAHSVGSGKSATTTAICAELIRLGLANKCMITVPNHIVEQWGSYVHELYPALNVMIADKNNFTPDKRAEFLNRLAITNRVIAIFPHTSFKMIPLKDATFESYVDDRIDRLQESIKEINDDNTTSYYSRRRLDQTSRVTLKKLEKKIKKLEARLQSRNAKIKRDDARQLPFFEDLGIDVIVNDESHEHKNLGFDSKMSNVAGLNMTESDRAFDMYIKTQYTLYHDGRVYFATATPVANTLAEIFTVMRYLQTPLLQELGMDNFDSWVRTFASVMNSIEMKVTGKWEVVQRLSRFFNLPELVHLLRQVWNVKNKEQLKMNEPTVYCDKPIIIKIEDTGDLNRLLDSFAARAERIKNKEVLPEEDNFLKITTDLRKAALDTRLVDPELTEYEGNKINACINKALGIYQQYHAQKYTQLIFCDISTPKCRRDVESEQDEFLTPDELFLRDGVYYDIKRKLIKHGVPSNEIAFIHDYKTPASKESLFANINSGKIRFLILSTLKGTGMNIQKKLIAVHYLTPPWRPTDIEQCDGRALRPGNEVISHRGVNEVYKFIYATKACAFMWQLLEAKARFISQVMQGSVNIRVAEDVDDMILNAAQVKAIATGDATVMRKVTLDTEMIKLDKLYSAWKNSRFSLLRDQKQFPARMNYLTSQIEKVKEAILIRDQNLSDVFSMELLSLDLNNTLAFTERKEAVLHLKDLLIVMKRYAVKSMQNEDRYLHQVGSYKGFDLTLSVANKRDTFSTQLIYHVNDRYTESINGSLSDTGIIQSLDYHIKNMDVELSRLVSEYNGLSEKLLGINLELAKPWQYYEKYKKIKHELETVNHKLSSATNHDDEMIDGFEFSDDMKNGVDLTDVEILENDFETGEIFVPGDIPEIRIDKIKDEDCLPFFD